MFRSSTLMVIAILLIGFSMALANWSDVRPEIRSISALPWYQAAWDTITHETNTRGIIHYWGDSLRYAAEELAIQIENVSNRTITTEINRLETWEEWNGLPPSSIVLGLWNAIGPFFAWTELPQFQQSPGEKNHPEGYYILADKPKILITASSLRGILYGVTTFGQALEPAGISRLRFSPAAIEDFPALPKRLFSFFEQSYSGNYPDAPTLVDSFYTLGRTLFLGSKCNGVVHNDKNIWYDNDVSPPIVTSTIRETLNLIRRGVPSGSSTYPDHLDKWANWGFDWYEGTEWGDVAGSNDNRKYLFQSVEVETKCTIGNVVNDSTELNIVRDTVKVENGDFESSFQSWNPHEGSSIVFENDNYFLRATVPGNGKRRLIHDPDSLQPHSGAPSRHWMLIFSTRKSTDVNAGIQIETLMDTLRTPFPDISRQDTAGDPYWFQGYRIISGTTQAYFDPAGAWQKNIILFETYGTKMHRLFFWFWNNSGGEVTIDLDSVEIVSADFYDIYQLPGYLISPGRANTTPYGAHAFVIRGNDTVDVSSSLNFRIVGNYGVSDARRNYSILHGKPVVVIPDSLGTPDSTWHATVRYWTRAQCRPLIASGLTNQGTPILVSQRSEEVKVRDSEPGLFMNAMMNRITWFENAFTDSGRDPQMKLTGFYCKENEIRRAGWTQSELESDSGYSVAYQRGNFLAQMISQLNSSSTHPPRQLIAWGEMFDPAQQAKRFFRANNPWFPVFGQKRGETEGSAVIPGVDDKNLPLVFISWRTHEFGGSDGYNPCIPGRNVQYNDTFEFWKGIVDTEATKYEVLFGYLTDLGLADWNCDSLIYRDLTRSLENGRELGRAFTGSFLFGWPIGGDYSRFYQKKGWIQWAWNPGPSQTLFDVLPYYDCNHSEVQIAIRTFPPDNGPDDVKILIDKVVLQYRFGLIGSWKTITVSGDSGKADSLYHFEIELPDSGGVCEYRTWVFDTFGNYSSSPASGTKWSNPEAGERFYFTFEKRKKEPITKPEVFYAPGILTQEYVIGSGGKLTIQPLPGFRYSTMYVSDSAKICFASGLPEVMPELRILGTDSTHITFALADSTHSWKGIIDSTGGQVTLKHVSFNTSSPALILNKVQADTAHVLDHAAFDTPIVINGTVRLQGTATCTGITVDSAGALTLRPGTELSFTDSARLWIKKGGSLTVQGSDTLPVIFKAVVDSILWWGVQVDQGSASEPTFSHCVIEGASAGVLAERSPLYVSQSTIKNCRAGVVAINGGVLTLDSCTVEENQDGVVVTNLSTAKMNYTTIHQNNGTGIKALSRATVYLTHCEVDSNHGDGIAGGLGLYAGSTAFLECNTLEHNTGPGITALGGSVMLSSVDTVSSPLHNWRGTSIAYNHVVSGQGQITLRGRAGLGLYNGHNRIADSSTTSTLIQWDDHPTRDWWRDVYWGSTDTAAILDRLPNNVLLARMDSSWIACRSFAGDNAAPDSLISDFLDPHNSEMQGNYTSARTGYCTVLQSTPKSDFAFSAADRLLNVTLESSASFDSTRLYLMSIADTSSDLPLKRWLRNSIGWCWAETDSFSKANALYDSLIGSTPLMLDHINAQVAKQLVQVRTLTKDRSALNACTVLAHLDTAMAFYDWLRVWNHYEITDSVVMYAPCRVDSAITVNPGGVLVIKPLPGTQNPVVRFMNDAYLHVWSNANTRGKLYVQGEADNRVTLDGRESEFWSLLYSSSGELHLKHAQVKGKGICSDAEGYTGGATIFTADSCTFSEFDDGLYFCSSDPNSYIRNSVLEGMGRIDNWGIGSGVCLAVIENGSIQVENSEIRQGDGAGVFTYYGGSTRVENSAISHCNRYGILNWEGGDLTLECCTVTDNGDTLPELRVEDGMVDLTDGHSEFSDSTGTLVFSNDPSYLDLEGGENGFTLLTTNGNYLESGDTTVTWDITNNAWSPVDPSDSNFFDYLFPSNPNKWVVDSSLVQFASCDTIGGMSVGGKRTVLRGGQNEQKILSHHREQAERSTPQGFGDGDQGESPNLSLAPAKQRISNLTMTARHAQKQLPISSEDRQRVHQQELTLWREFRTVAQSNRVQDAIQLGMQFVNNHPGSERIPSVLVKLADLAKTGTTNNPLSKYLENKSQSLPNIETRKLAKRLSLKTLAYEGKPHEALSGLEALMETSETPRDSIKALMDAMGIYFFHNREGKLQPRYAQVRNQTMRGLVHRLVDLAKVLDNPALAAGKRTPAIPKEYKLYQNYPNPFNPITTIHFDLPEVTHVELKIYNILGQEVATLINEVRPAGAYRIFWDSRTTGGVSVASGVYIYRLKAGIFEDAKKMMLIR